MTTLFVRPIDPTAPGSWKERRVYRAITKRLQMAARSEDMIDQIAALEEAEDWVIARLRTDDGSEVQTVLDSLSADEFDRLLRAAAPEDTVGEASAVPSAGL